MKRFFSMMEAMAVILSLTACGTAGASSGPSEHTSSGSELETMSTEASGTEAGIETEEGTPERNILVAYFSWADNAILADDVDAVSSPSVIPPGNVQQLAGWVQEETGGDIFSIRVADPYPSDWDECLERANEERGEGARPELVENVADIGQYDTVFLGYPNWWYGVPMALLSFLEQNDLSGKQVYLFCSHGTGGLANSVELITEASPEAIISDNIFDCYEEEAASSEEAVKTWVDELGYACQTEAEEEAEVTAERQISVRSGDAEVIYSLNDGNAADSLYEMLPLTVEVEDYSTNEKIFYPPEELACAETPLAMSDTEGGTLAYDLYEIRPAVSYTRADLNWQDKYSRSSRERNDPSSRPELADGY
ncbi:MAG TPA: hypothetical protein H9716_03880 [Candidatus Enterocloster faecavium]|uniref:Flavodoxin-like domain-containing protein n=1 Tax=Candidatus Enterocloster faecavium TaxID=2838560 RepID=A0A9D2RLJ6_9FIRM|nr:hypothetical protein [Candidatus Enterocloster faecavium]